MPDTDTRSFADRRRDAVLLSARQQSGRLAKVGALVIGDRRPEYVADVIEYDVPNPASTDIDRDSYVVEVGRAGGATSWTTVHLGKTDRTYFADRDVATLHLIAQRHGAADSHASAAFYAARLLRVPEGD